MICIARVTMTVVLAALLTGCGTVSLPLYEARPAPADRVTWKPPAAANATVVIARDTGFTATALWVYVSIDGLPAAQLDPGEKVELPVSSGNRRLLFEARGTLNQTGKRPISQEVSVGPGEQAVLRVGFSETVDMAVWRER